MNTIKILLTYYLNVSVHTQIYQIAESSRIKKIDSIARIESNRNFFCPNWNALLAAYMHKMRILSLVFENNHKS